MRKGRVLIVDDEPAFLSGLWGLFGQDYQLSTATNAEAALEILARDPIAVVLSDYKMPGMDGLSLLIEVKRRHPGVARVLMTAYADMPLVVRALNEGEIQRFLAKPFRAVDCRKIIDECLELARIAAQPSGAARGKAVLVAHDSASSQATLRLLLSSGFRVTTTGSGIEVMNQLAKGRADALVLGVALEFLDGCTICTWVKKEQRLPLPVVFWTGQVEGPYQEYLSECGADLVLDQSDPDSLPALQRFLRKRLE